MFEKVYTLNSASKNIGDITFTDYYYRLNLLARSVFEWKNLPNGIDEKWIEKYLFYHGCCMFFKDKEKGFMVSKTGYHGTLNFYDEPTRLQPIATNYESNGISYENGTECVLIHNNDLRIPTEPTIMLYAYRLAEIQRTSDININAQKTPVLLTGSKNQMLSLKTIYKQYQGNEPAIFGDKSLETNPIQSISTEAPIVFDKLRIEKNQVWNECMTFLGINNANMDKRERLVDDEVIANNEQIQLSAQVMLKARQRACDEINNLFGLNISVDLRNKQEKAVEDNTEVLDNEG